jgi:hypothetical protein
MKRLDHRDEGEVERQSNENFKTGALNHSATHPSNQINRLQDQARWRAWKLPPDRHRNLFATAKADIQRFRRLIVSMFEQVRIDTERRADLGMTEPLADHGDGRLRTRAGGDRLRRPAAVSARAARPDQEGMGP